MSQYPSGRLEAPPSLPVSPAEQVCQALDVFLAPLLLVLGSYQDKRLVRTFASSPDIRLAYTSIRH